jgi:hypothetical protein
MSPAAAQPPPAAGKVMTSALLRFENAATSNMTFLDFLRATHDFP